MKCTVQIEFLHWAEINMQHKAHRCLSIKNVKCQWCNKAGKWTTFYTNQRTFICLQLICAQSILVWETADWENCVAFQNGIQREAFPSRIGSGIFRSLFMPATTVNLQHFPTCPHSFIYLSLTGRWCVMQLWLMSSDPFYHIATWKTATLG